MQNDKGGLGLLEEKKEKQEEKKQKTLKVESESVENFKSRMQNKFVDKRKQSDLYKALHTSKLMDIENGKMNFYYCIIIND